MSIRTPEDPIALKFVRFAIPLTACLAWLAWSSVAFAADIDSPNSIECKAKTVHGYQNSQGAKSWDTNDQLPNPTMALKWRPNPAEGPVMEIEGTQAELVAVTDNSVVAVHGSSDSATAKRWLYAVNFRLESVLGLNVESNAASLKGRAAEYSCDFEATP